MIAFLIASPLAYWAMHLWLQNFTYKASIGPLIFILTVSGATLITLLTISIQTISSARKNPVESLKQE